MSVAVPALPPAHDQLCEGSLPGHATPTWKAPLPYRGSMSVPAISQRLKVALAANPSVSVNRQKVDWTPHSWNAYWKLHSLPRPDIVSDLTNLFFTRRTIPRSYLYRFAQPLDIERLLIGVLAWGYGSDRNGRARSAKTLTVQTESPKTPFDVATEIVTTAQTQGAKAGFSALFNGQAGRLRQMGTAFGTKLIHFGAYRQAPGPPPLIFDENAWKAFVKEPNNTHAPPPGECNSSDYLAFCTWCADVATAEDTTPGAVEYCLYALR